MSSEQMPNPESSRELKLEEALSKLGQLFERLNDAGFRATPHLATRDNLRKNLPFPIVRDGLDGARAVYDYRSGELKVMFTNGFENPANSERQQIEAILDETQISYPKFKS